MCVACICRFRFIHRVDVQYRRRLRLYTNMSKADGAIRTISTAGVTRCLPSSEFRHYLESSFRFLPAIHILERTYRERGTTLMLILAFLTKSQSLSFFLSSVAEIEQFREFIRVCTRQHLDHMVTGPVNISSHVVDRARFRGSGHVEIRREGSISC